MILLPRTSLSKEHSHPYQNLVGWALLVLSLPLLWWVSHPARQVVIDPITFVFWHTAVEVFAVVVAMLVFVTGYRAILSVRKGAVVWLGVAFLGVGLLDFLPCWPWWACWAMWGCAGPIACLRCSSRGRA